VGIGPGYRWLVYQVDGTMAAAVYVGGRLLRRSADGWWTADFYGRRVPVADRVVRAIAAGTAPPGWPIFAEHVDLVGDERDLEDDAPLRWIA
jgi:hypothetical protein